MNTESNNKPDTESENTTQASDENVTDASEAQAEHESDACTEQAGSDNEEACEVETLKRTLDETQQELDRHREAMLRMQAEVDNQRKRMAREMEKAHKFALERIMKDLLQVRDSLERGLEVDAASATVEGLREGKALTLRMLAKVMQDHGLEIVDPAGEAFNPEFHEAMSMIPSPDHEDNTVIEVLQKGFKLNDRLIRPAMVVVSRRD